MMACYFYLISPIPDILLTQLLKSPIIEFTQLLQSPISVGSQYLLLPSPYQYLIFTKSYFLTRPKIAQVLFLNKTLLLPHKYFYQNPQSASLSSHEY